LNFFDENDDIAGKIFNSTLDLRLEIRLSELKENSQGKTVLEDYQEKAVSKVFERNPLGKSRFYR
jgi:hypothetical protein